MSPVEIVLYSQLETFGRGTRRDRWTTGTYRNLRFFSFSWTISLYNLLGSSLVFPDKPHWKPALTKFSLCPSLILSFLCSRLWATQPQMVSLGTDIGFFKETILIPSRPTMTSFFYLFLLQFTRFLIPTEYSAPVWVREWATTQNQLFPSRKLWLARAAFH